MYVCNSLSFKVPIESLTIFVKVLLYGTPLLSSTGDEFSQLEDDPEYQKMTYQVKKEAGIRTVHMYTHIHTHTCAYSTYTHIYTHTCAYSTYTHIYTDSYIHSLHTDIHIHRHRYIHTYTLGCMYTDIHKCTHIHTHTYCTSIHTHTCTITHMYIPTNIHNTYMHIYVYNIHYNVYAHTCIYVCTRC